MNEREHCRRHRPAARSLLRPPPLTRAASARRCGRRCQTCTGPTGSPATRSSARRSAPTPAEVRARAVEAAIDRLADEPKGDQLRAVLHRTFVRAAPTQEAAAEVLGLPFSTYRRHLAKAIDAADRPALGGGDRHRTWPAEGSD